MYPSFYVVWFEGQISKVWPLLLGLAVGRPCTWGESLVSGSEARIPRGFQGISKPAAHPLPENEPTPRVDFRQGVA